MCIRDSAKGMEFGLWFEPEMVNPDSDVARNHPDWILSPTAGRLPLQGRTQQVLDLTNPDAFDYIYGCMDQLVGELGKMCIRDRMCTDPRVAFVSFESESSAAISRAPIESKISELLSQYADNEQTKGDWRLLNGKRWMVFGEASKMTALQQQWGGELETITAAADTADSGNA